VFTRPVDPRVYVGVRVVITVSASDIHVRWRCDDARRRRHRSASHGWIFMTA